LIFSRDTCKKEVSSFKDTGINTHIFFGVRAANPKTSTLGKAIGGGACQPSPSDFWHCAMMEYEESDIAFARVRIQSYITKNEQVSK
jgi:hypothetical protein